MRFEAKDNFIEQNDVIHLHGTALTGAQEPPRMNAQVSVYLSTSDYISPREPALEEGNALLHHIGHFVPLNYECAIAFTFHYRSMAF